jgi:cobalt/nickel transport protein
MNRAHSTNRPHRARSLAAAVGLLAGAFVAVPAQAHFLEAIPAHPVIDQATGADQTLTLRFTHPMEGGPLMDLALESVQVIQNGTRRDLTSALQEVKQGDLRTYKLKDQATAPGDMIYTVTPKPYWEPAEGKLIVHYTKVVVDAFGGGEGWDQPVGLPVEIEPLTRPYGGWAGSVFQGRVLVDGTPRPFAEIEIEYRGQGKMVLPADSYVTQVVKADANGVFTVGLPRAGWWGFAALVTGARQGKAPDGSMVPVEDGGLLWVYVETLRSVNEQDQAKGN